MLIGGPNQSHKVNFKEPLPSEGKVSKETFSFFSVNPFPENIRKKIWPETTGSPGSPRSPCPREHGVSVDGKAEHAKPDFLNQAHFEQKN
jgi:hypothetical protein